MTPLTRVGWAQRRSRPARLDRPAWTPHRAGCTRPGRTPSGSRGPRLRPPGATWAPAARPPGGQPRAAAAPPGGAPAAAGAPGAGTTGPSRAGPRGPIPIDEVEP